jgi:fructose-bisphosphate aldolase class II
MVSYKTLGFVNTKEMFAKAMAGKYAVPAYNFNNMEQLQAIIDGCGQSKSPVILQVSKGARQYANEVLLRYMGQGAVEMAKSKGYNIPVTLHLDHGDTFETVQVVRRQRFLVGHDRRLAFFLRREHRTDQEGRRIRPCP